MKKKVLKLIIPKEKHGVLNDPHKTLGRHYSCGNAKRGYSGKNFVVIRFVQTWTGLTNGILI